MTAETGPIRQQAGPPEWFKPGKSSRSRSHIRSRSASVRSHHGSSSDSASTSDSESSDDTRSGKVSYREWMRAGSKTIKDQTGHRLIWGYEDIHEQLKDKATPLVLKEKEIKQREEEERRQRRQERREKRRAEKDDRRKRRKQEKEDRERHLERIREAEEEDEEREREEPKHSQKYDLKEAAKQTREAQKAGAPISTVQGKSILLNLLQSTLHENRVRDGELVDKARVVFKQAGFDEGGRVDVKLLSAHLNSNPGRVARKRNNDQTEEVLEGVVPVVSYDEFKQRQHEARTEDRKAKIRAKMQEQKAKAQAFIMEAQKAPPEQRRTNDDPRDDVSSSVDSLLAAVSASLEAKKGGGKNDLNTSLWAMPSSSSSHLPPVPPFPHLPS